jgi:hypothetical protein
MPGRYYDTHGGYTRPQKGRKNATFFTVLMREAAPFTISETLIISLAISFG